MAVSGRNIARRGGDKDFQSGNQTGSNEEKGIVIGIVKENAHPVRMGNIMVHVPESGAEGQNQKGDASKYEDDPKGWRMVRYATPWYSRTEVTSNQNSSTAVKQVSGIVFPAPDIGTKVLCAFPHGKNSEGFWFACAPDPYMLQTLPEMTISDSAKAPDGITPRSSLPAGEFNDKATDVKNLQDFTQVERPADTKVYAQLVAQGFDNDEIRGFNNSGYMRETPSEVLGMRTKGRRVDENGTDLKDRPDILDALRTNNAPQGTGNSSSVSNAVKGYQRNLGHSFTMDDGDTTGNSNQVRLRTSGGHQIVMNDTQGILYINNQDNTASIQFDQMGNINIVSDASINFKGKNINFDADDGFKFNAKKNFDVFTGQEVNLQSVAHTSMISEKNIYIEGKAETNMGSGGGAVKIKAGADLHLKANSNMNLKANSKINLQGPAEDAMSRELIEQKKHPRKDTNAEGFKTETIDHDSIVDSTGLNSASNIEIPYADYSTRPPVALSGGSGEESKAGATPAKKGIGTGSVGPQSVAGPAGAMSSMGGAGFPSGNFIPPGASAALSDVLAPGKIQGALASAASAAGQIPGFSEAVGAGGSLLAVPGGALASGLQSLTPLAKNLPSVSGLPGVLPISRLGALNQALDQSIANFDPSKLGAPGGLGNAFGSIAQGLDPAQAVQSVTGGVTTSLSSVATNLNNIAATNPAIGNAVASVGLGNATNILGGINNSISQIANFTSKIPGGAAGIGNLARGLGVPDSASKGLVQTLNTVGADGLLGIAKTLPGVDKVLSNGRFVQQVANNLGVEFPMPSILQGGYAAGAFRKRAVGGSELTANPLTPGATPQRYGSGLTGGASAALAALPAAGQKIAQNVKGASKASNTLFANTVNNNQAVVTPQGFTNVMPGIEDLKNIAQVGARTFLKGEKFDPVRILQAPEFNKGIGGIDAGTLRGMAAAGAEFAGSNMSPFAISKLTGAIGKFGATASPLVALGFLKEGVKFNGQMLDPRAWTGKQGILGISDFLGNNVIQDQVFQLTSQLNIQNLANIGAIFPNDPTDMQAVMTNLAGSIGPQNVKNLRFGKALTPFPLDGTTTTVSASQAKAIAGQHAALTSTAVSSGLLVNASMNPSVSMENASYLAKPDAADNLKGVIEPLYLKMCSLFGEKVPVNDAIPKPGSSRETNRPGSKHFSGFALDLGIGGYDNAKRAKLVRAAKQAGFKGFGFGRNIMHVDTGPTRHWAYGNTTFAGQSISYWGSYVRGTNV